MQKHVKNFIKHYKLAPGEPIECGVCGGNGVDIHHIIFRSQGGGDEAENLLALCRGCHNKAHSNELTPDVLFEYKAKFDGKFNNTNIFI